MARLTWENVAAPQLGEAARILETGFQGFANGASGIADTLMGIRERQKTNRSAAAFDVLSGVRSEEDVSGALARIASMVAPQDRTDDLQAAMMALREGALGFDSTRANTRSTIDANNRQNVTHERGIRKEDQLGRAGAAMAGGFRERLGQSESGGDYSVVNSEGFTGKYQWGQDRLDDFNRATGMSFSLEEFRRNPQVQEAAQEWHEQDILKDLGKYVGTTVNGQVLDEGAIVAMAHLGGKGGAREYIQTGGRYDPADSNGTNLSDYARKFGNTGNWLGTIGEGNLITPADILDLVRTEENVGDDMERNADDNRDRDARFVETQNAREMSRMGRDLATQMLGEAAYAEDVAVLINRSDAPTEVKQAAINFLKENPELAAANFSMPYDPNASGPPGSAEAATAIDSALTVQENAIKSDNTMRIQTNATKYGDEPAPVLAQEMGDMTADGVARITEDIGTVVSRVKAEYGISITPAQAAALIKETTKRGGWSPVGDGRRDSLYADVDAAVELASQTLTPEMLAASKERLSQFEMSKASLEKDKADLIKVGQALALAQSQTNPDEEKVARLQEDLFKLQDSILTKTGAAPEAPAAPATSGERSEAETSRSDAPAPAQASGPEAALQQAEIAIAANAIVRATGGRMTPERLAGMPQEQQLMVLGGVLDELIAQRAPEAEILAVQGVIEAVQTQRSAGVSTTVAQPVPAQPTRVEAPVEDTGPSFGSRMISEIASRLPSMPSMPETPGLTRIGEALGSLRGSLQAQPTAPAAATGMAQPGPEVRAQANSAMTNFLARPQTAAQNPEAFMEALDILEASLPPNHPVLRQAQDLAVRINAQMTQSAR